MVASWKAINELEAMLTERGIGGRLVRVDEPKTGMSVLSVTRDLTIWVQGDYVSWRGADGSYRAADHRPGGRDRGDRLLARGTGAAGRRLDLTGWL